MQSDRLLLNPSLSSHDLISNDPASELLVTLNPSTTCCTNFVWRLAAGDTCISPKVARAIVHWRMGC